MPTKNAIYIFTIFSLLTILIWNEYNIVYANETIDLIDTPSVGYNNIERRNHIRFNNTNIKYPVQIISIDERINNLIDISREGLAISHNETISQGEIIPITIKYNDIEINTSIQIISSDKKRAGAKFIVSDKEILNDLLYLSIVLEYHNGMLKTRLKEG